MKLTDKVAIITGGASGIGRAIAEQMAKEGAITILADVNMQQATEVAEKITASGGKAFPYEIDVRSAENVKALVDDTVEKHGKLDYMFNNAGIAIMGDVNDMSIDQYDRLFDINVRGVLYGIHAACAVMKKQGHGHIVNTASLAGLIPAPQLGAYAGTKHAVVGISESLRVTAKQFGVKVSAVCPGFIDTPIVDAMEIVNEDDYIDRKDFKKTNSIKYCPVDKAARSIIKGVKRNKALIVVTFHANFLWRLYRFSPGLTSFLAQTMYKKHDKAIRK